MLDSGGRDAARFDPVKHVALCAEVSSVSLCQALVTMPVA